MMRTAMAIALLSAMIGAAGADTVVLARDGQPAATIVLQAGADVKVKQAALDLQKYVRQICGVTLPVVEDGRQVDGSGLYIGNCEPSADEDLPAADLNPESYAIRAREGDLYFAARWPTPVCFAVYSFIEDDLGVRWFAPGNLWEWVPQGNQGELTVDVESRVVAPGTSPRIWSGHAWFDDWKDWNLRNKTVLSEVVPRRQFQNFIHNVITPQKYGETHPEYFPLVNGERYIPEPGNRYWRPCESNPEVQRLVVEYARKWFDDHPNIDSFSVGMDDISHLCSCDNCRAWDPEPDSYEKRKFSDRHYKFVNVIAKEIAKTHPDRYVGTLIYNIARELPQTVDKLEDNVFGFITETSALWWQEGRQEADHELTRQWARRCRHLSRYDYYGMGTFTPRVYPHAMDEQIKFDKSLGLEGMYIEVYTFLPFTAPMIWSLSKLQWDHTLDIDALLDEFYTKMYGPAAPIMKEYFDMLEREWNTPREGRAGWVHRNIRNQALAVSPEAIDRGMEMLQKGINSTGDPDVQERIAMHRAALRYAGYAIKAYSLSQELTRTVVDDEATAADVLAKFKLMGDMAAEREAFWAECHTRDDLLGENLRGLGDQMGYLQTGKITQLETGAVSGAMKALAWYSDRDPAKMRQVLDGLGASASNSVVDTLRAWTWVQETKPQSLLVNGDFEDTGENVDRPEKDWQTTGAPRGWSTWSRNPSRTRFEMIGGKGRNGSVAAAITGADSGVFIQDHKVRPGEKYLVIAWAKPEPAAEPYGVTLSVRFRDENGAWHARRDLEPTVTAAGENWQPLVVLVTVPEGTGSLLVMPGASGQGEDARVLFDDVGLFRCEG